MVPSLRLNSNSTFSPLLFSLCLRPRTVCPPPLLLILSFSHFISFSFFVSPTPSFLFLSYSLVPPSFSFCISPLSFLPSLSLSIIIHYPRFSSPFLLLHQLLRILLGKLVNCVFLASFLARIYLALSYKGGRYL